jgi:ribonuclease H / adenosylcobalamin/alpha-ribazole phosphatase
VPRSLIVAADGGSRGNPGPAGYGAVVLDAATGEVLAELRESIGRATNNVAEYSGLLAGLREAARIAPGGAVQVRMDSRLVVEQMTGRWKIKHPDLLRLAQAARAAAASLGPVTYTWVPRERNAHADRLANKAMDASGQSAASAGRSASRSGGHDLAAPRGAPAPWRPAGVTPTTTILLRHGQTRLSTEQRFAGTVDVPLTETGVRQAEAAAARLAARGGLDLIVTSPLQRARQTADVVAAATGAAVQPEEGFREGGFGKWEGLSFAEASSQWPEEMAAWLARPGTSPPGGESFADVAHRVGVALDELLAAQPARTVLIVSHLTPVREIVARALLAPSPEALLRMHLDVAALCEIDWYPGGPASLRSFNDTAHLRDT